MSRFLTDFGEWGRLQLIIKIKMTAHSQNSSQKISPNKLKERLFLAGIAEKIANILSLPQTWLIFDIPSDILPTEYVSHIVVQLSRICEKHRVAFHFPENKESSQHGWMGHFISLIRGHCPNWYIWDHMRLWDSPRSVPIGWFGELLVPLDSRITRYGHFVSSLVILWKNSLQNSIIGEKKNGK